MSEIYSPSVTRPPSLFALCYPLPSIARSLSRHNHDNRRSTICVLRGSHGCVLTGSDFIRKQVNLFRLLGLRPMDMGVLQAHGPHPLVKAKSLDRNLTCLTGRSVPCFRLPLIVVLRRLTPSVKANTRDFIYRYRYCDSRHLAQATTSLSPLTTELGAQYCCGVEEPLSLRRQVVPRQFQQVIYGCGYRRRVSLAFVVAQREVLDGKGL